MWEWVNVCENRGVGLGPDFLTLLPAAHCILWANHYYHCLRASLSKVHMLLPHSFVMFPLIAGCGQRKIVSYCCFKAWQSPPEGALQFAYRQWWLFRDMAARNTKKAFFHQVFMWVTRGRPVIRLTLHLQTTPYLFQNTVNRHKSAHDHKEAAEETKKIFMFTRWCIKGERLKKKSQALWRDF